MNEPMAEGDNTLVLPEEVRDSVIKTAVTGDTDANNGSVVHSTPAADAVAANTSIPKLGNNEQGIFTKTTLEPMAVLDHLQGHSVQSPFTCGECDEPFTDASALSKHTALCHSKPDAMKFSCGICGKKFANKWQCSAHLKAHCDHLEGAEKPTGGGKFPCDVCGRGFKTNKRVREHRRTHTGEKPFSCDLCDKSFNRQDRLKIHKRYHTGERPYQCPHCDKNFTENSTLFRHIATHDETKERPFSCDQCPRSFRRKFQLLAHMSAHQCQKNNKCDQCDKYFAAPSLLKEHMRVHSGERPFPCTVCGKNFRNVAHVKRHMLTHTKPKPFQCVECDKSFGLQVRLDNHIRRTGHTGENQFACSHCKRTFKKKSNYSSHLRSHKIVEDDVSTADQEQEEFAVEEMQSSTNELCPLSEPQLAEAAAADSTQSVNILEHDPIIQVLICTNEGKFVENDVDFDSKIPASTSTICDGEQNGLSTSTGNFDRNLSTVVILLQNGLEDTALTEPCDNVQTEVLEESSQFDESEDPL